MPAENVYTMKHFILGKSAVNIVPFYKRKKKTWKPHNTDFKKAQYVHSSNIFMYGKNCTSYEIKMKWNALNYTIHRLFLSVWHIYLTWCSSYGLLNTFCNENKLRIIWTIELLVICWINFIIITIIHANKRFMQFNVNLI